MDTGANKKERTSNVYIYFNLHKKTFSIRHKGKVVAHTDSVRVSDPNFKVYESGRQRVINEKRKNVHAFIVAPIASIRGEKGNIDGWDAITYNPYRDATFVRKENREAIHSAYEAYMYVDENKKPHIFART